MQRNQKRYYSPKLLWGNPEELQEGRETEISSSTANRIFAITVPRDLNKSSIDVSFEGLQDASNELDYPL